MVQRPILDEWTYVFIAQVCYQFLFTVFCFFKTGGQDRNIYWSPGWFYFGLFRLVVSLLKIFNNVEEPNYRVWIASRAMFDISNTFLLLDLTNAMFACFSQSLEYGLDKKGSHKARQLLKDKSPRSRWAWRMLRFLGLGLVVMIITAAVYSAKMYNSPYSDYLHFYNIQKAVLITAQSLTLVSIVIAGAVSIIAIVKPSRLSFAPNINSLSRSSFTAVAMLAACALVTEIGLLRLESYRFAEYIGLIMAMEVLIMLIVTIHMVIMHRRMSPSYPMITSSNPIPMFSDAAIDQAMQRAVQNAGRSQNHRDAQVNLTALTNKPLPLDLSAAPSLVSSDGTNKSPEPVPAMINDPYFRNTCVDAEHFLLAMDQYGTAETAQDFKRYFAMVPVSLPRYRHASSDERTKLETVLLPAVRKATTREAKVRMVYAYFMALQFSGTSDAAEQRSWIQTAISERNKLSQYNGCVDWPWKSETTSADTHIQASILARQVLADARSS